MFLLPESQPTLGFITMLVTVCNSTQQNGVYLLTGLKTGFQKRHLAFTIRTRSIKFIGHATRCSNNAYHSLSLINFVLENKQLESI